VTKPKRGLVKVKKRLLQRDLDFGEGSRGKNGRIQEDGTGEWNWWNETERRARGLNSTG